MLTNTFANVKETLFGRHQIACKGSSPAPGLLELGWRKQSFHFLPFFNWTNIVWDGNKYCCNYQKNVFLIRQNGSSSILELLELGEKMRTWKAVNFLTFQVGQFFLGRTNTFNNSERNKFCKDVKLHARRAQQLLGQDGEMKKCKVFHFQLGQSKFSNYTNWFGERVEG